MAIDLSTSSWTDHADLSAEVCLTCEDALARVTDARAALKRARQAAHSDRVLGELVAAETIARAARALRASLVALGAATYERAQAQTAALPARRDSPDMPPAPPSSAPVAAPANPLEPIPAKPPEPIPAQQAPPPAPLTPDDLGRLQAALNDRSLSAEPCAEGAQVDALIQARKRAAEIAREAHNRLQPTPERLRKKDDIQREVDVLVEAGGLLGAWSQLDAKANLALTSWMCHRARAAQKEVRRRDLHACAERLDRLFQVLSGHSKRSRPGLIHGLAREHEPEPGESWLSHARASEQRVVALFAQRDDSAPGPNIDDALRRLTDDVKRGMDDAAFARRAEAIVAMGASQHHTRLVRLATIHADALPDTLADLRRAALAEREADLEDDTEPPSRLLSGWPWLPATLGKTAIVVGGDPRPERVKRIKEAFGFREVEWVDQGSASGARLDSLLQKMRNGTVDVVIMMRAFSSHTLTDRTFALKDAPCITVLSDSYGIQQIKLAIERYAQPASPR